MARAAHRGRGQHEHRHLVELPRCARGLPRYDHRRGRRIAVDGRALARRRSGSAQPVRSATRGAGDVTAAIVVAVALFLGVILYALFGGADVGSGFSDLTAGSDEAGAQLRTLVDHSIGPVWEANHVWLIYILVIWWTGFPSAFAAATTTLFVPLMLALAGIVLRGASFAFRKYSATMAQARLFGAIFAGSSLITPFFLGTVAGAIASGRVPAGGYGDRVGSGLTATPVVGGCLAVASCVLLAGVFLTADAARAGLTGLAESLRTRTLIVGAV